MRFAICDDELIARETAVTMLEDYIAERKLNIDYEVFDNYPALADRIEDFEVFLMDYMTPEMDGLSFAKKLRETYGRAKTIIFISSYTDIVYDTFSVQTHRFLTKPIDKNKFFEALDTYFSTNHMTEHIVIQNDGEITVVNLSDIYYILVNRKELYICTKDEQHLCHRSIASVEEELSNCGFFRVHRSYLVNLSNIKSFNNKEIEFEGGEKIPVSTRKYSELCKAYLKMK